MLEHATAELLTNAIVEAMPKNTQRNYHEATVLRTDEDGVVWVSISGGAPETPVSYVANECDVGDTVSVVIENGKARIVSNLSKPSASSETVERNYTTLVEEIKMGDDVVLNRVEANYAKINAANITELVAQQGWLDKIMVQTGMLSHQGTIYELAAIQVNASSIKTGTLDVERLIITETDEHGVQQKYLVHVDAQGAATYEKMDGNIIQDLTITTDKLVAGAVTADKITTQNIEGTGGWINLRSGTFAYLNATTGQGIAWDGQHLTIAGSVTVGDSQLLLEQIAEMAQTADETLQFKVDDDYLDDTRDPVTGNPTQVRLTARLYKGATDIAPSYPDNAFAWFIKKEGDVEPVPLDPPNGRVITISVAEAGYGAAVKCRLTPPNDAGLLNEEDDELTNSEDVPYSGRTPSGDHVRISDLSVVTRVFDTDKVMLVGSEDEHLVSIATLKETFGDGDYERLSNRPSIEGVTLSGDKTFPELGIFQRDQSGYDVPDDYMLSTMDINALWANSVAIGA